MPTRAKRPCAQPGCPNLVASGRYCAEHTPRFTERRGTAAQRGYGYRWQRLRRMFLNAHPLCADPFGDHQRDGVVVAATDVDHIVSRRAGGTDAWNNLQSLCHSCHSRKTATQDGGWGGGAKNLHPEPPRPRGQLFSHTREID